MDQLQDKFAERYRVAAQMLELSDTLIQAAECVVELDLAGNTAGLLSVLLDMGRAMMTLQQILETLKMRQENSELVFTIGGTLDVAHINDLHSQMEYIRITLLSAKSSLSGVTKRYRTGNGAAQGKVKYELLPFCIVLYERIFDLLNLFAEAAGLEQTEKPVLVNRYRDDGGTGVYKYKLSVCLTAYNKLKYTRMCVECLLKYLPSDISCEMILVNHGSSDETKAYFESVSPTKQVDVLVNGSGFTSDLITEGEYILGVTNDVLITQNAVRNLLTCMESHEDYGFVVPTTPNISNLQSIEADYGSMEEMFAFAERNNQTDPYRWEERFRLCNPISLQRARYPKENLELKKRYREAKGCKIFPDDSWSYYMRRNGYKNILAKDAYCYHFGSVTIRDQIEKNKNQENDFYASGRLAFKADLGIDPWGQGLCFDQELCGALDYHKTSHVDILAVNCGYGSTPLKIKESIKEVAHNLDVHISAVTDNSEAAADAEILSDRFKLAGTYAQLFQHIQDCRFDYIVMESDFSTQRIGQRELRQLFAKLRKNGVLAVKNLSGHVKKQFQDCFSFKNFTENWSIAAKVQIERTGG